MDLHEDPDKNLVTATLEVPGMTKDNIEVNVQNGCLAITAENKQSSEYDESGWAIRERRFGKYSRILQLPAGVKVCSLSRSLWSPTFIHRCAGGRDQGKDGERSSVCHIPEDDTRASSQEDQYCLKGFSTEKSVVIKCLP